jgi:hypothetical protein
MTLRPGQHKSQLGDWRPVVIEGPINPRARMVHSQVQSRTRRERRRASSEGKIPSRRRRELGPSELQNRIQPAPGGLWGWLLALAAMLGGNRRPWDERRRKRERRRAAMSASKAARPGRDLQRRPGIFQRKTG